MYKRKIAFKPLISQNIDLAPKKIKDDNFRSSDIFAPSIENYKITENTSKRNVLEEEENARKKPSHSNLKSDSYDSGLGLSELGKQNQLNTKPSSSSQASSFHELEIEQDRIRKEYFNRRWAEVEESQRRRESQQSDKISAPNRGHPRSQSSVSELEIEHERKRKEYFDKKLTEVKSSQRQKIDPSQSDKESIRSKRDHSESRSSVSELEVEHKKIRKEYFDKKCAEVRLSQLNRKSCSQSSTQKKNNYDSSDDDIFSSQRSEPYSKNQKHLNSNNLKHKSQETPKIIKKLQLYKIEAPKLNGKEKKKSSKNKGIATIDDWHIEKVSDGDGKRIKNSTSKIFSKSVNSGKGGKEMKIILSPSVDAVKIDKYKKNVSKSKREELKLSLSPKPQSNDQDVYSVAENMQIYLEERTKCGTFVCCDKCDKWRYLKNIHDPLDLPEKWYCHMNKDSRYNNCTAPEEDISSLDDLVEIKYNIGSIVWAKLDGYAWWPAMVDVCPDTLEYFWLEDDDDQPTWYNVTFFDKNAVSRAWCKTGAVQKFENKWPNVTKVQKQLENRYLHSIAVANQALKSELSERIAKYAFTARYKGKINFPDDDAFIKKTKKSKKHKKINSGLVGQRAAVHKKSQLKTNTKKWNYKDFIMNPQNDKENIDAILSNNLDPNYFEENELML